jgi:histidinol-phosphatase (PHP family)
MPWFSYHSGHSGEFCRHAKGSLLAVLERAVEAGFTHYGLSEHVPRDDARWLFPGEEDLGTEGLARLFEAYALEARELAQRFEGRLQVLVGFETERLPETGWQERMRAIRAAGGFDYCVGSVHHVGEHWVDFKPEINAQAAVANGGLVPLQIRYFEQLTELVQALRPEVVGHLDLVRKFDGPTACFDAAVTPSIVRALEAVRDNGGVLDVNAGAHRRGLSPVYPLPWILERAHGMGIGVTLGDDSHGAHDVGVGLDACMTAIAAAGYREVHYLTRREGAVQWAKAALSDVRPQPR